MIAAKTPPKRVRLTLAQMTRALEMCRERLAAVEKRERALRAELRALRMLYKVISRARDYNSKPGVNFTPSIRRALEDVDGARAALAAADEGEAGR